MNLLIRRTAALAFLTTAASAGAEAATVQESLIAASPMPTASDLATFSFRSLSAPGKPEPGDGADGVSPESPVGSTFVFAYPLGDYAVGEVTVTTNDPTAFVRPFAFSLFPDSASGPVSYGYALFDLDYDRSCTQQLAVNPGGALIIGLGAAACFAQPPSSNIASTLASTDFVGGFVLQWFATETQANDSVAPRVALLGLGYDVTLTPPPAPIPVPATLPLLLTAVAAAAGVARRKARR